MKMNINEKVKKIVFNLIVKSTGINGMCSKKK